MNLTEIKPCQTFDSLNDPVSKEKIQKTIKMWKNNKTTRKYCVSNEMIKYSEETIIENQQILFNKILDAS